MENFGRDVVRLIWVLVVLVLALCGSTVGLGIALWLKG